MSKKPTIAVILAFISSGPLLPQYAPAQNLEIYCIEVGLDNSGFFKQGDSTLVISPDGTRLLVDGGATGKSGADSVTALFQRVIPAGGLDYIVTTHYDGDHMGGLVDIATHNSNQYFPLKIYDLGGDSGSRSYEDTFSAVRQTIYVGEAIDLGGGCTALCVSADGYYHGGGYVDPGENENARSIGLLIRYGGFDYLTLGDLTGTHPDVEDPLAAALEAGGYNIDVLHASHHGSKNSTNNAFVADLLPEFAVISTGDNNGYGHPHQYAINHLNALTDDGDPYAPPYDPVTTIYTLERGDPGSGTAENVTIVGNGHDDDPAQQGSLKITVDNYGYQFTFANEGPNTNAVNDGPYYADDGYQLLITEAAVDDNDPLGHDWVELYMVSGTADLSSLYMTDHDSVFRIGNRGSLTMNAYDVLIIHDTGGASENDVTGKGLNDLWDIYQSSLALAATDDQFIITTQNSSNPEGDEILDAVCWSNDDGEMPQSEVDDGNDLIAKYHWGDPTAGEGWFSTYDQGPAIGDINDGYAQRVNLADYNDVNDWTISESHSHGTPPAGGGATPTPTDTPTMGPTSTPTPTDTPTTKPTSTPTPPPPRRPIPIHAYQLLIATPIGTIPPP